MVTKSVLFVIIAAILKALWKWCRRTCGKAFSPKKSGAQSDEEDPSPKEDANWNRNFIVVEFNAWECAGSDVLWAAVISKIFDAVSPHRGRVVS